MNDNIKTISMVVIALCLFVQTILELSGGAGNEPAASTTTAATQTPPPSPNTPDPNLPKTTIKFDESDFDFGNIKEGEKVSHKFKFTNTGTNPLVIANAFGTCGCTVPSWPKEPIAVGATGEILIEYDSKGKSGIQQKTVTVIGNTEPQQTILNIKSNVEKVEEKK